MYLYKYIYIFINIFFFAKPHNYCIVIHYFLSNDFLSCYSEFLKSKGLIIF